ncbi:MAG: hypothetical protein M3545_06390 [Acidobacteriota bacterium]|nr:hypothetical protein [Acidobacteriota bacterium]
MAITKRTTHPPSIRKTRVDLPLSPAWKFTLMVGELPTARLTGWVQQAQDAGRHADGTSSYDDMADALWQQHGADLTREAAANTFVPFWASKHTPTGPGFEQWLAAFIGAHRY